MIDVQRRLVASAAEGPFDDVARELAVAVDATIALVTVLDDRRQWFMGRAGLEAVARGTDVPRSTPLTTSLCCVVADEGVPLVVRDLRRDTRLRHHPATTVVGLRSYLGHPLRLPGGVRVGSVCAADVRARRWSVPHQRMVAAVRDHVEQVIATQIHAGEPADAEDRVIVLDEPLVTGEPPDQGSW